MKSAITALITLLLLAGCATTASDMTAALLIQPGVVVYSPVQQDKMADEIQGNACPALNNAMADYSVMRDQVREAKK